MMQNSCIADTRSTPDISTKKRYSKRFIYLLQILLTIFAIHVPECGLLLANYTQF